MPAGLALEVVLTLGAAGTAPLAAGAAGAIDRPDGSRSDGGPAGVDSIEVGCGPGSTMMAGGPGSGGPGGGDGLPVAPASSASSSSPAAVNAR